MNAAVPASLPRMLAVLATLLALATPTDAHEVRPAYLELKQVDATRFEVLWKVPSLGDELRLRLDVVLPEGTVELGPRRARFTRDAYVERWSIEHPGALVGGRVAIEGLRRTFSDVLVRIERLDGSTQVVRLMPDRPWLTVDAAPSRAAIAWTYLALGVEHILFGIDHLLFVLALLLLVRGGRKLLATITAFTLAHSVTLALAALGVVHVPGPPVEAIIALSIVFVAAEVLHGMAGRPGLAARKPWLVAFSFGLLHGLGFASALAEIGLPQQAIPLSLLCFNLGVEAGQVLFVTAVALLALALRRLSASGRGRLQAAGLTRLRALPAYGIGSLASYWMIERIAGF